MPALWFKCDGRVCGGYRLHAIEVKRDAAGRRTREAVCTACDERKPFGICCPNCGGTYFKIVTTRHRPGGVTVRVKRCGHCRHRIRTRECYESNKA